MRLVPWLFGCLLCCAAPAIAADNLVVDPLQSTSVATPAAKNSGQGGGSVAGLRIDGVAAAAAKFAQPAIEYDTALSVAEFNQRQAARDPAQNLLVRVQVPKSQLSLRNLADRPVQFEADGAVFEGRVAAAFLPSASSDEVLLHAVIQNQRRSDQWMLRPGTVGTLSIPQ